MPKSLKSSTFLIQTWLRFANIPPAIARRLHALGAFVEASLQRLEGRVLETMRTLELMKVECELRSFEGLWGKVMLTMGFSDGY